jgi:hypothetical protein
LEPASAPGEALPALQRAELLLATQKSAFDTVLALATELGKDKNNMHLRELLERGELELYTAEKDCRGARLDEHCVGGLFKLLNSFPGMPSHVTADPKWWREPNLARNPQFRSQDFLRLLALKKVDFKYSNEREQIRKTQTDPAITLLKLAGEMDGHQKPPLAGHHVHLFCDALVARAAALTTPTGWTSVPLAGNLRCPYCGEFFHPHEGAKCGAKWQNVDCPVEYCTRNCQIMHQPAHRSGGGECNKESTQAMQSKREAFFNADLLLDVMEGAPQELRSALLQRFLGAVGAACHALLHDAASLDEARKAPYVEQQVAYVREAGNAEYFVDAQRCICNLYAAVVHRAQERQWTRAHPELSLATTWRLLARLCNARPLPPEALAVALG